MSVSNAAPSVVSPAETARPISRTNLILLVILLAQVAVTAFVFWPRASATVTGTPLLAGVNADEVTALTITDDNDRSVSFTKTDGVWTLADTEGYPANSDKISQTLTKLVAMTADRLVTRTPGSHGRLQVADDDYLRKVDITTPSGVQTLYLGSSTGASATHVRAAGQDATYLTNEIATWELDTLPTTWINVAYFKVPKEKITEVTLQNANGTFTFVHDNENPEEWTLADATADEPIASANINTLIDRIATLNLHTVLGKSESPEYGLSEPLATLTVSTSAVLTETTGAEAGTTTLLVGAKDDETNTYILKSSGSEFYVRLAAFTGDEFVNKQRSDFMIQGDAATENAPENGATSVVTGTNELESGAAVTTTDAQTNTSELESEPTAEPSVEATGTQTDTTDLESTDETTSTTTPEPSPTPTS
ncbi:MAG: DUF4340 domain-containing protein [Caldilineaceae bacterium]|nr:DUF4340 domain-containing protein [Caldilineaceae bacterium]